jgi:hypothetical protein
MSNSGSSSSSRSILAGDDMEPEDPVDSSSYRSPSPPPRVAAIVEPPHRPAERVHLPPFWPTRPAAWFGAADAAFHLRRVTDGRDKFSYVIAMLGEDQLVQIADVLEICPPPPDAFDRIKQRLIQSHTMDEFQRLDLLLEMPALGGQRPSVLLAEMRQLCPAGEVDSKIFRGLFLRRLPQEIRLALAEDHLSPILAMAARADALLAHSRGNVAAAAVPSPAATPVVAAATPSSRPQQNSRPQQKQPAGQSSSRQSGHHSICYAHWRYGADARRCEQPCAWRAEN